MEKMKKFNTERIVITLVMALMLAIGLLALFGCVTGIAVMEADRLSLSGMILGITGILFVFLQL